MKGNNRRSVIISALIYGAFMFVLNAFGPFSRDNSLGDALLVAVISTVFFGGILWLLRARKPHGAPVVVLDDEAAARVDSLMAEGKDVAAIKAVRDATGASLVSAKATVDARRPTADHTM